MFKISMLTLALTGVFLVSCAQTPSKLAKMNQSPIPPDVKTDTATFGEGCFWCTEAFFQRLNGVYKVISGYGGGFVENPTYEQVCDKNTGHVELCQIIYDPAVISYDELLEVFWKTHDPTTIDRQGNDAGPQYRSVIFYTKSSRKRQRQNPIKKLWTNLELGLVQLLQVLKLLRTSILLKIITRITITITKIRAIVDL